MLFTDLLKFDERRTSVTLPLNNTTVRYKVANTSMYVQAFVVTIKVNIVYKGSSSWRLILL